MRPVANREAAYRVTAAEPALQFQCFGGEGAGGLDGVRVMVVAEAPRTNIGL